MHQKMLPPESIFVLVPLSHTHLLQLEAIGPEAKSPIFWRVGCGGSFSQPQDQTESNIFGQQIKLVGAKCE